MEKIEISTEEYNSLKKIKADKELLESQNAELVTKNKELGENIVKAKDSLKEKHKEQLLTLSTEKTALETENKVFKEKLGIGEDVEDLEVFLDTVTSDLSSYSSIKKEQQQKTAEAIQKYTDFIKTVDKEGEDYLSKQVEIFGESVLTNEKALKGFAEAKGFKESTEEAGNKSIKVGEFKTGDSPNTYNSFKQAEENGDIQGMSDAFFGN